MGIALAGSSLLAATAPDVASQVTSLFKNTALAELPVQSVNLVGEVPKDQRMDYATEIFAEAAQNVPTALVSIVASLVKANPDIAADLAVAAAKAAPKQLTQIAAAAATAAPNQLTPIVDSLSRSFPKARAALSRALIKIFPTRAAEIRAAIESGKYPKRPYRSQFDDTLPPLPGAAIPPPRNYAEPKDYGKG